MYQSKSFTIGYESNRQINISGSLKDGAVHIETDLLIDTSLEVVDANRAAYNAEDFAGPIRFNMDGELLHQTNEDGVYVDNNKNVYYDTDALDIEIDDEYRAFNTKHTTIKRLSMTPEEEKFLDNFNQEWPEELDDSGHMEADTDNRNLEYASESAQSNSPYTNENTEISYDELVFWRKITSGITWNVAGVKKHLKRNLKKEWMTREKVEYVLGIIHKDQPIFKFAKYVMLRERKNPIRYNFEYNRIPDNQVIGLNNTHINNLCDKPKEIDSWKGEIIIKKMLRETPLCLPTPVTTKREKVFHIRRLIADKYLPQGWIVAWATINGEITQMMFEVKSCTSRDWEYIYKPAIKKAESLGYKIDITEYSSKTTNFKQKRKAWTNSLSKALQKCNAKPIFA